MKNYLTIGEVSSLLGISKSTLRFWEESGIFKVIKGDNNYRGYTLDDLLIIAEIYFYRNLGFSVKQLKDFESFRLSDYETTITQVKSLIDEEINKYIVMRNSLKKKEFHIQTINIYKNIEYSYGEVPIEKIIQFNYDDAESLKNYTNDPSLYVRVINSKNFEDEVRGIIPIKPIEDKFLIWKKESMNKYAIFLIEENASRDYSHNMAEKLKIIQKKHNTGRLLANYLLSENINGETIDYLLGYVEIFDYE